MSNFPNTVSIGRIFLIKNQEDNNVVLEIVDFVEKEFGELTVYKKADFK